MHKIKVIIKRPGEPARVTNISDSLKNIQNTVDGPIKAVTIASDAVVICNEEGRIRNLPYNCSICGIDFVGTIIFAGIQEGKFTNFPLDFKDFKKIFGGAVYGKQEVKNERL